MAFTLKKIVEDLKNLEDMTMQCMKCGICQSVCPLYEKDVFEPSVSRGKISLVESIYEGRIDKTAGVLKYLDYCILCGRCKRYCPSSVKTDEIFVKAKATLRKINKLPAYQKAILKTAIEKPKLIESFEPLISAGMKIASSKVKSDIRKLKFPAPKNMASIKPKPFTSLFGGLNKAKNEKMRVIFYPGCAISYIYTNWGEAIVKTLNHFGVSVYVPKTNKCCGIPAATMGEMELYEKMVNENLNWFESIKDADYIITACPTCQWGLSDLGARIAKRTIETPMIDIVVFLSDVLNIKIEANNIENSTLHIPCHYDHTKDNALVSFIQSNVSAQMKPLNNQSCCGFGGTFNLKHPKDSKDVGNTKIEEIKQGKFDTLYTPCPGCAMQLTDLTVDANCSINVKHPIETLYEQIKGETNG